uniref:Uncharacterized protein n=1 Tax=Rhizophora mucronata TaxID=61149 RepID=A0A2P2NXB7_RHIMU
MPRMSSTSLHHKLIIPSTVIIRGDGGFEPWS